MTDALGFAIQHPLIVLALLAINSGAMVFLGVWIGSIKSTFATKAYVRGALEAFKTENANTHDEMAHRYQKTMEDTASRVKEIFEDHKRSVADLLKGSIEEAVRTRQTLDRLTKDTFQLKGAVAVLLPKGTASQIFTDETEG